MYSFLTNVSFDDTVARWECEDRRTPRRFRTYQNPNAEMLKATRFQNAD